MNSRKNHFAVALSCDAAKRSAGVQDGDGAFANALLKVGQNIAGWPVQRVCVEDTAPP